MMQSNTSGVERSAQMGSSLSCQVRCALVVILLGDSIV